MYADRDVPLLFRFEGFTRYVPLALSAGFFAASVLWALIGPIDWKIDSPVKVFGFVGLCLAALVGGYVLAVRRSTRPPAAISADGDPADAEPAALPASGLLLVASLAFLVLYLPVVHASTGRWYPDVITGLTDAGAAYERAKDAESLTSGLAFYLKILAGPLTILILPLTLFFWPRLTRAAKVAGATCLVLSVALTVSQGVNKGVADICAYVILFLVLLLVSSLRSRERRRAARSAVGIVLVAGLFLGYYVSTMNSRVAEDQSSEGRVKAKDVDDAMSLNALQGVGDVREGHLLMTLTPTPLHGEALLLSSYLTHGYRGLAMAMDMRFEPTWGLGFSEFYRHNLVRVAGQADREEEVKERTYAGKLTEAGWPDGMTWSTFFIHPASDLSFYGVVPLMGLIGFGFGLAWRDTLVRRDPLACGVAFHLCILVFYLPANNQLFQGGELAIGFVVVTAAWLLLRTGRFRPRHRGA
ncbi:hypothetical protein [Nocardioides campestrisoli]|uniref:hypothetical protein n=1 Tax=Nocardioides campestrisoli TaxID=2736757 RepID=UPI0015E7C1F9|nr:hypothetical protein [Nocardioides campestrisoli]